MAKKNKTLADKCNKNYKCNKNISVIKTQKDCLTIGVISYIDGSDKPKCSFVFLKLKRQDVLKMDLTLIIIKKTIAFMACDIFNLWIKIRQWNPLKNHNILLAFFATK